MRGNQINYWFIYASPIIEEYLQLISTDDNEDSKDETTKAMDEKKENKKDEKLEENEIEDDEYEVIASTNRRESLRSR